MKRESLKILIVLIAISFIIQIAHPADIFAQEDTATEDLGHYEWGYDGEYFDIFFNDELGVVVVDDGQTVEAYYSDGKRMEDDFVDFFYGGSSGDYDYDWGYGGGDYGYDYLGDDYAYIDDSFGWWDLGDHEESLYADDWNDSDLFFPDEYWDGLDPAGDTYWVSDENVEVDDYAYGWNDFDLSSPDEYWDGLTPQEDYFAPSDLPPAELFLAEEEPLMQMGDVEMSEEWQTNFNNSNNSPYTGEALEYIKADESAAEFLNNLGID